MGFYAKFGKRAIDFTLSLFALLLLWPILLVLWILVRVNLGAPAVFRQERAGKDERPFTMYKFRTMTDARDEDGNLLPDAQRKTKLGAFLRSTSLDELPELLNILKGDLSVIGPRPLMPAYSPYYKESERARFQVRGGLIPPEVLYDNVQPTWEEQFAYESEYATTLSFLGDVKVLFAVIKGIFTRYKNDYGDYVRKPLSEERREKVEEFK